MTVQSGGRPSAVRKGAERLTRIQAAGQTDQGLVRERNEDALFVGSRLFLVADGMGGASGGDVASAIAVEVVSALDVDELADADAARELEQSVISANDAVLESASEDVSLEGMGTTLTAALVIYPTVHIGHVGDSRAYLLRDGKLEQVTKDHTLVEALVSEGKVDPEEAADHPRRSVLTQCIGSSSGVEVEHVQLELQSEDRLLLCTDGLSGIEDGDIRDALLGVGTPAECASALIDLANKSGGRDNTTVIVLAVDEVET